MLGRDENGDDDDDGIIDGDIFTQDWNNSLSSSTRIDGSSFSAYVERHWSF